MGAKPDRTGLFEALYGIAVRGGCEEALFGDSMELVRPAFERTLIGDKFPITYLEFPLLGKPGFDLQTGYCSVPRGSKFAEGAGYGRQDMIDWLIEATGEGASCAVGFEVDATTGRNDVAGVYLQYRKQVELLKPYLDSIGEGARADSYLAVRERMAEGWPPQYVGLFPGRADAPMRIGGYFRNKERLRCAEDPQHLAEGLDAAGYTWYTDDMLSKCSELMGMAPDADFQLDIYPDGSLGDTFGLSLDFTRVPLREARECFERGYGAALFGRLEEWGVADGRWRHIPDTVFARHIAYDREDGSVGRLALVITLDWAKVKFVAGVPAYSKFYLMCKAVDLP